MSVNPEVILVSLSLHFLICEGLYLRLYLLSFYKHISVVAGSVSHPSSATTSWNLWRTQTVVGAGASGTQDQYLNLGDHEVGGLQKTYGSGGSSRGPKCRTGELVPGRVGRKGTGDK